MTDIVERLRRGYTTRGWDVTNLHREAAAEIERLRTTLEGRIGVATNLYMECERLRAENHILTNDATQAMAVEIERLRDHHARNLGWEIRARAAEAEIEGLRNALECATRERDELRLALQAAWESSSCGQDSMTDDVRDIVQAALINVPFDPVQTDQADFPAQTAKYRR